MAQSKYILVRMAKAAQAGNIKEQMAYEKKVNKEQIDKFKKNLTAGEGSSMPFIRGLAKLKKR